MRRRQTDNVIVNMAKKLGISPQAMVERILINADRYSEFTVKRANAYKQLLRKQTGGRFFTAPIDPNVHSEQQYNPAARTLELQKIAQANAQRIAQERQYAATHPTTRIGPARQLNYAEQQQANAYRQQQNAAYVDGRIDMNLDENGNVQTSQLGTNVDDFSRKLENSPIGRAAEWTGAIDGVVTVGDFLGSRFAKNAWKFNPLAYRGTEGMMYRGIGEKGLQDALESNVFRANQSPESVIVGNFDYTKKFNRTYWTPKFNTAEKYGEGVIAEVPNNVADFSSRYKKTNWSQSTDRNIPIEEGKILKRHWLKGYKEIPKPVEPFYPKQIFGNSTIQTQRNFENPWINSDGTPKSFNVDNQGYVPPISDKSLRPFMEPEIDANVSRSIEGNDHNYINFGETLKPGQGMELEGIQDLNSPEARMALKYLYQNKLPRINPSMLSKNRKGGNISKLGYSRNSPYRHSPFLDINTPQGLIDMSNTDIPLMAQDMSNGELRMLPPNSGMHQFEGDVIREHQMKKGGKWIQKAVNPAHKGYCTPMTKATCTPRRKALARTFKKHHGFHQEGGEVSPENVDNILLNNTNKNFVNRYVNRGIFPVMNNEDGTSSTLKMESSDSFAYPTIIQNNKGQLVDLHSIPYRKNYAYNHAMDTGEFLQFPTDEQANWFAENGYKTGAMTHMKKGGSTKVNAGTGFNHQPYSLGKGRNPENPYINYGPLFKRVIDGEGYIKPMPVHGRAALVTENTAPSVSESNARMGNMDKGGNWYHKWVSEQDRQDELDDSEALVENNTAPSVEETVEQIPEDYTRAFRRERNRNISNSIIFDDSFSEMDIPVQNGETQQFSTNSPTMNGNSIAATHNNPGNLKYANWMQQYGAVPGKAGTDGGRFAVFPNVQAGLQARAQLLKTSPLYKDKTVNSAMKLYSNNGYDGSIFPEIKNKKMSELSPQEFAELTRRQIINEDSNVAKQLGYLQKGGTYDLTPEEISKLRLGGYKFKIVQ